MLAVQTPKARLFVGVVAIVIAMVRHFASSDKYCLVRNKLFLVRRAARYECSVRSQSMYQLSVLAAVEFAKFVVLDKIVGQTRSNLWRQQLLP